MTKELYIGVCVIDGLALRRWRWQDVILDMSIGRIKRLIIAYDIISLMT